MNLSLAAIAMSTGAYAATITVDAGGDIAAANATAVAGDVIDIAAGTYAITAAIEMKDGVTCQGAGSALTIIDCGGVMRAFVGWGDRAQYDDLPYSETGYPANTSGPKGLVIQGLAIINGVADDVGKSVRRVGGPAIDPPLTSNEILDADKSTEGGGILLENYAEGTLIDVAFDNCNALATGIDTTDPTLPTTYLGSGGAVRMDSATANIVDCSFTNNSASDDGGAIMVDGAGLDVAVDNCAFNLNSCGDDGGAIRLSGDDSNYTITGCSFTDSACGDDGGAIQMAGAGDAGSIYTVTDTTFTGCHAVGDDGDGGAIQVSGDNSSYVWADCTFTGCYASDDGGAFKYGPNQAELTMTNCAFIGNGIDPSGTVVTQRNVWQCNDEDAGPLTIINCLFADNATADDRLVEVKGGATILNCTFANNVVGDKPLLVTRGRPWDSTGDQLHVWPSRGDQVNA